MEEELMLLTGVLSKSTVLFGESSGRNLNASCK